MESQMDDDSRRHGRWVTMFPVIWLGNNRQRGLPLPERLRTYGESGRRDHRGRNDMDDNVTRRRIDSLSRDRVGTIHKGEKYSRRKSRRR